MFVAARAFFALPAAEKEAISLKRSPHNRGYVALGGEALDPTQGVDQKEAFNICLDLAPDHPDVVASKPFRGVNLRRRERRIQARMDASRPENGTYFLISIHLRNRYPKTAEHEVTGGGN